METIHTEEKKHEYSQNILENIKEEFLIQTLLQTEAFLDKTQKKIWEEKLNEDIHHAYEKNQIYPSQMKRSGKYL